MSDENRDNPRRDFLRKSLTLIPVVTLAGTGLGSSVLHASPQAAPATPAAVGAVPPGIGRHAGGNAACRSARPPPGRL